MTAHPDLAVLDRLKTRIHGLRSKTTDNGCIESEALLAATSAIAVFGVKRTRPERLDINSSVWAPMLKSHST